jgi:hypothetical protein
MNIVERERPELALRFEFTRGNAPILLERQFAQITNGSFAP